jgi:hypothetical protein
VNSLRVLRYDLIDSLISKKSRDVNCEGIADILGLL